VNYFFLNFFLESQKFGLGDLSRCLRLWGGGLQIACGSLYDTYLAGLYRSEVVDSNSTFNIPKLASSIYMVWSSKTKNKSRKGRVNKESESETSEPNCLRFACKPDMAHFWDAVPCLLMILSSKVKPLKKGRTQAEQSPSQWFRTFLSSPLGLFRDGRITSISTSQRRLKHHLYIQKKNVSGGPCTRAQERRKH
jgi:hypothetical protein